MPLCLDQKFASAYSNMLMRGNSKLFHMFHDSLIKERLQLHKIIERSSLSPLLGVWIHFRLQAMKKLLVTGASISVPSVTFIMCFTNSIDIIDWRTRTTTSWSTPSVARKNTKPNTSISFMRYHISPPLYKINNVSTIEYSEGFRMV